LLLRVSKVNPYQREYSRADVRFFDDESQT
jgi:hypothetical protein